MKIKLKLLWHQPTTNYAIVQPLRLYKQSEGLCHRCTIFNPFNTSTFHNVLLCGDMYAFIRNDIMFN